MALWLMVVLAFVGSVYFFISSCYTWKLAQNAAHDSRPLGWPNLAFNFFFSPMVLTIGLVLTLLAIAMPFLGRFPFIRSLLFGRTSNSNRPQGNP